MIWDHRQWERTPCGARHIGARPGHQRLVRLNRDGVCIAWVQKCDAQEVLTQHVVARDDLLGDREVADGAVSAWGDHGAEPIRSAGAQPLCRPVGKRDTAPLFERGEEVGEGGVAKRVSLEVEA